MNFPIRIRSASFAAALCSLALTAASAAPTVAVAKFPDDRAGALSFTFDDALPSHSVHAGPLLAEAGFKATFYIVTVNIQDHNNPPAMAQTTSWKHWKALLEAGHEIGSHTVTHRNLNTLTAADAETELTKSKQVIQEKLGIIPVTLAYPYAAPNAAVLALAKKHYPFTRITSAGYGDAPGFAKTAAEMDKYADDAVANGKAVSGLIHGLTEPYASMDPAVFKQHLAHCKALSDQGKLWVATFLDVSKYAAERDSVKLTVQSQTPTRIVFLAESALDPALHDFPLTYVITVDGAALVGATATRAGAAQPLPAAVKGGRILVKAVPGPGAITVDWSGSALAPLVRPPLKAMADLMRGRQVNGRKRAPAKARPIPAL